MANTTFANLKIKCLRRAGNHYNANDSTLLEIAGGVINDVLGQIQVLIAGTPYTLDLDNTVNTVAETAATALTDTDIIEILQVYQRTSGTKLKQLTRIDYVDLVPDTTRLMGVPEFAWAPTQALNVTGQNIWSIYTIPVPSAVVALRYDYIKNLRFTSDGTAADAAFSPLPQVFDKWIADEFRPLFFGIVDPANSNKISRAELTAEKTRAIAVPYIRAQTDRIDQAGSYMAKGPLAWSNVATTADPT